MKQTEEIFKNGFVTSAGGRGRIANANGNANTGTAYVNGTWGGGHWNINTGGWSGGSIAGSAPIINYTPKQKAATEAAKKDFRETVDYIEILIDRIERKIDELDTIAGSAYRTFEERNNALTDGFSKVSEEIDIMNKAYNAYVERANKVGLSQDYKNRIMNGELRIEDITDEALKDQIDEFQEWYEKALDCKYAITDLEEALGDLVNQNFENIVTQFDSMIESVEHDVNMLEKQLELIEARGQFAGQAYYDELMKQEQETMNKLQEEYIALQDARNEAIWGGSIKEGSEADLEFQAQIDEVAEAWKEAQLAMQEYWNDALEMDWSIFEYGIEQIDNLVTESEFLRDVLATNENDLFNKDTGKFTDAGWTSGALMAQDYNAYMAEADQYAKKVLEIDKLLAEDPNNTILIDKKNEYIQAQQDAILAANEEKIAIQSLVSDSYDRQLDALDRLISKRKEELEAEKD